MQIGLIGLSFLGIVLAACTSVKKPFADLPPMEQQAMVRQYKAACEARLYKGAELKSCIDKEIDKKDQAALESYKQHKKDIRAFWFGSAG